MAEKELIVVAGPNGAGKTTFAQEFLVERPMPYLSADAIAAEIAPHDPTSARIAAGREFLIRLEKRIAGDESFLVESTFIGPQYAANPAIRDIERIHSRDSFRIP